MDIIHSRTGLKHKVKDRTGPREVRTACGQSFVHSPESRVVEGDLKGSQACKRCKKTQ